MNEINNYHKPLALVYRSRVQFRLLNYNNGQGKTMVKAGLGTQIVFAEQQLVQKVVEYSGDNYLTWEGGCW